MISLLRALGAGIPGPAEHHAGLLDRSGPGHHVGAHQEGVGIDRGDDVPHLVVEAEWIELGERDCDDRGAVLAGLINNLKLEPERGELLDDGVGIVSDNFPASMRRAIAFLRICRRAAPAREFSSVLADGERVLDHRPAISILEHVVLQFSGVVGVFEHGAAQQAVADAVAHECDRDFQMQPEIFGAEILAHRLSAQLVTLRDQRLWPCGTASPGDHHTVSGCACEMRWR